VPTSEALPKTFARTLARFAGLLTVLAGNALCFGQPATPLPPYLPAPPIARNLADFHDPRIPPLMAEIAKYHLFAAYRELADIYENNGFCAEAAAVHHQEAAWYRQSNMEDAAIIEDLKAAPLETDLRIFVDTAEDPEAVPGLDTHMPAEPALGCYLGAFIDRDDNLGPPFFDQNWGLHRSPEQFRAFLGRNPGSLFTYLAYGQRFPSWWVARLKSQGVVPQIAWEPPSLYQVQDDAYLEQFARDCRDANWPVFFRFACEMNGSWTPYHGNPALYREKFRLINQVLHRVCPLAATIWCVGNPPGDRNGEYYPGDDGCDWVGVNFYAVPWIENNPARPGFTDYPLAMLDPIYQRYAARKPIAICEFAASHEAAMDHKQVPNFAIEKLSLVYDALPLLYPRVKLIDWFDMNSMVYPKPGNTLSDFRLTSDPTVAAAWNSAVSQPYFLNSYQKLSDPLPPVAEPLAGQRLDGIVCLRLWARAYVPRPKLYVQVDGRMVLAEQKTGSHALWLDTTKLAPGTHSVTAYLYDDRNRFVTEVAGRFGT